MNLTLTKSRPSASAKRTAFFFTFPKSPDPLIGELFTDNVRLIFEFLCSLFCLTCSSHRPKIQLNSSAKYA